MKVIVQNYPNVIYGPTPHIDVNYVFFDGSGGGGNSSCTLTLTANMTGQSFLDALQTAILADAVSQGYTMTADDIVWSVPSPKSFNNPSRSFNSNYTASSSRDVRASYSVSASWTIAALLSGSCTAFLEYSLNGGSSWATVNQVSKSLALLTFAGSDEMNLCGSIPAGALVRIRTTTSNMALSYVRGQEILD